MKNRKGFTLIELLAVIIILGVLLIIAVPSVTKYINDSRKSAYVDTAKEIASGTRNVINEGKLGVYDTGATYYVPVKYIKTENASKSPYGDFVDEAAFVAIVYDGTGYRYYWISVDETGQGVDKLTPIDDLDIDDIKSNINKNDITDIVRTTGIGGRDTIKILQEDGTWETLLEKATNNIPEDGGGSSGGSSNVTFTSQATPDSVTVGDTLTLDDLGDFKVIEVNGNTSVLLPRYNLNVGSNKISSLAEFAQSSSLQGGPGAVIFSNNDYWTGNVGSGKTYPGNPGSSPYAYVFDSNSALSDYATRYQGIVRSKGLSSAVVKLMTYEQASSLQSRDYSYLYNSTFWLGSARWGSIYIVENVSGNSIKAVVYNSSEGRGFRPVIVVNNSDLL